MKKIWVLSIIAFSAATVFYSCSNSKANDRINNAAQEIEKTAAFALRKDSISTNILLPAELTGFRQADLHAKISSYIKEMKVDIGSKVKAGQLLVLLEAPEMSAQLAAAQSRMKSEDAIYIASNSTYKRILETSKVEGTISANDLEQALAKKNADYARVEASRANYHEINNLRSYLEIRAPFDGVITQRNVNVGAFVGGGNNMPLITIQESSKLRLSVAVPEAYAGYLTIGNELSFTVNSVKGETFHGKVSRKAGALDSRLRSEQIEMDVENTDAKLLPGMIGKVSLSVTSRQATFVVPKSAVMTTSEGVYVIRVINGKATWIAVETGLEAKDNIEIFSTQLQLDENDTLILKATESTRDGSPVSI